VRFVNDIWQIDPGLSQSRKPKEELGVLAGASPPANIPKTLGKATMHFHKQVIDSRVKICYSNNAIICMQIFASWLNQREIPGSRGGGPD
jgi:hypothetical protein